jgi:hypothetical protein
MELLNVTGMNAGYTVGMQPDGRELLVIIVKGTFQIPPRGRAAELAAEQVQLVEADVFAGEPGVSAPLYETDYVPRKPRCDVLLNGSAYAPGGYPTERVRVGLRVAGMTKVFDVVGNRVWREVAGIVTTSRAEPFTTMPIGYHNAFGGIDRSHPDPSRHRTYLPNHAGQGFFHNLETHVFSGKPLPNTEDPNDPVAAPNGRYRPMAFGPIGRGWEPRPQFAGTYDERWIENVFPFLPADFDERYYQAAPADQQVAYLRGGEQVTLFNLSPQGRADFALPSGGVPVTFLLKNGEEIHVESVIDTLTLEPDLNRFTLVWRASRPLRRDIFEVAQVVAGVMPASWYRARRLGKSYYSSLQHLIVQRQAEREAEDIEA